MCTLYLNFKTRKNPMETKNELSNDTMADFVCERADQKNRTRSLTG